MPGVTCEDLMHALRDSGLHDEPQLAVIDREVAPLAGDPQAIVRHLVVHRFATLYQLKKIINGKAAELFVGPFVVLDKLGEGGMGKVYKVATWKQPDQVMALKVVRAHLLANPVIKMRYDREVHAATALRHPNIVSVFDSGESNGRFYLAMEFVDGIDLAKVVKDYKCLLVPEACEYVRQAALGLQHAHESGFVHRDVKPSNILVCGERHVPEATGPARVKLLDMGLVREMGFEDVPERGDLTRVGTVVGTPDYMSPEQARNSSTVDARSDVYSLGCTLFYLLTGRPPFVNGTPMEKLFKHQLEPAPMVRDIRPDVPESLSRLIVKLMAKSPEGRPLNARSVAAMLEPFTRYDFRSVGDPVAESANRHFPTAPTTARANAAGLYSLADDSSHTGEGRPPSSSPLDIPSTNGSDSAMVGAITPTSGPATNRLPSRAVVLVADPPRAKPPRKKKNRRRRPSRRRQTMQMVFTNLALVLGLIAMGYGVWYLIRITRAA